MVSRDESEETTITVPLAAKITSGVIEQSGGERYVIAVHFRTADETRVYLLDPMLAYELAAEIHRLAGEYRAA